MLTAKQVLTTPAYVEASIDEALTLLSKHTEIPKEELEKALPYNAALKKAVAKIMVKVALIMCENQADKSEDQAADDVA